MIDIIKKKFNIDEKITLYTSNFKLKGFINEFHDEYIEIETTEGIEFVKYQDIIRFSIRNDVIWQDDTHGTFTDTRDGKTYKVVRIGRQVWLAENFNYTKGIPHITDKEKWFNLGDNKTDAAWCYYNNKPENGNKYGALYTWAAALKVAPEGWHLPTKEEWETLLNNYGGKGQKSYKALIKGGNSDLNVLFGGWRDDYGYFSTLGSYAGFWSATEGSCTDAWDCFLDANVKYADLDDYAKSVGLSVRLLRD